MYSQPQSGYSFTKEGDLRKFMLGDTKLDVNSHCLLTREVRCSGWLVSKSLALMCFRSCAIMTRSLNEACTDLYRTTEHQKLGKKKNKVFTLYSAPSIRVNLGFIRD